MFRRVSRLVDILSEEAQGFFSLRHRYYALLDASDDDVGVVRYLDRRLHSQLNLIKSRRLSSSAPIVKMSVKVLSPTHDPRRIPLRCHCVAYRLYIQHFYSPPSLINAHQPVCVCGHFVA